jgi:hypothetical protein
MQEFWHSFQLTLDVDETPCEGRRAARGEVYPLIMDVDEWQWIDLESVIEKGLVDEVEVMGYDEWAREMVLACLERDDRERLNRAPQPLRPRPTRSPQRPGTGTYSPPPP